MSKIYITGASCAGVTTLGAALARTLDVAHVDCDDHYWMLTDPPYTEKRLPADRVVSIGRALGAGGWVLTGAFDGWGDQLVVDVDLIVFVLTPTALRMERLVQRERDRYGDRIAPGGDMFDIHTRFAAWAAQYDNPSFAGRNRARHENWLAQQRATVLRLDGRRSVEALVSEVCGQLPPWATPQGD